MIVSMVCPICNKPADPAAKPFCSPRCAQIDLGRWFGGHYSVPGRDGEALDTAKSLE